MVKRTSDVEAPEAVKPELPGLEFPLLFSWYKTLVVEFALLRILCSFPVLAALEESMELEPPFSGVDDGVYQGFMPTETHIDRQVSPSEVGNCLE